jgi:hypothetical protein
VQQPGEKVVEVALESGRSHLVGRATATEQSQTLESRTAPRQLGITGTDEIVAASERHPNRRKSGLGEITFHEVEAEFGGDADSF